MRDPLTPTMLRHAADLMEGRAAGMKIMATPHDGAKEGGLQIGPTLHSLGYYLLSRMRKGWKLRLVERENHRQPNGAGSAVVVTEADESSLLRKVADLLDGASKGVRIRGVPPGGAASDDVRIVAMSDKLLDLLRRGWALRLEGPERRVPLTDTEMLQLSGRVLVWPSYDRLCVGTLAAGPGRAARIMTEPWNVSAQQLLDDGVCWRSVDDVAEHATLRPCWTVVR